MRRILATSLLALLCIGTATFVLLTTHAQSPVPAFPGAQGAGASSIGGRGGQVFEVTNLKDSGSGSLRDCAERSGARTCIFRVAGIITQKSDFQVNNPYLTIAGQTAPGEVILGGPGNSGFTLRISAHDTTVRYLTISPDNFSTPFGPDSGTVGYSLVNAVVGPAISDHLTVRWAGNKGWNTTSNFGACVANHTMQWTLFYEAHEGHPVGPSTSTNDNATTSACEPNADFHHNLLVNLDHRIPEFNNYSLRWINNITYNYSRYAVQGLGATKTDVIGNVWDYANLVPGTNGNGTYPCHSSDGNWPGSIAGTPSWYVAGNIGFHRTTPNPDQYGDLCNKVDGEPGNEQGPFPANWKRSSPLPPSNAFPIVPDDATQLSGILVPTVGNSQHLDCHGNWVSSRDVQDTRIVNQWLARGPGGFWPNGVTFTGNPSWPAPLPNWTDTPNTAGFSPCTESLHDGIPDQWKTDHSLSTTDTGLAQRVSPTGYTYLENYLNGSGNAAPPPPNGTGRPLPPVLPTATPH